MRRRSKEPRRISVVEGRAAESLARVWMTVSCFIYNDETLKRCSCQSLPQHLFQICSWMSWRTIDRPDHKPAWTANRTNRFVGPTFASPCEVGLRPNRDRKSKRLNSSHLVI